MGKKVLIIGSGGREHSLAWKIAQSPLTEKIYCAPGNGGTHDLGENVPIKATDPDALLAFAQKKEIDFVIVGPEAPLVDGIVDLFESADIPIFGPSGELARLEGSKVYSKELLKKFNIPTADFQVFDNADEALSYVRAKGAPIVIKADGLAAGKGVIIAKTLDEAAGAIDMIMRQKQFGFAGSQIIIEDMLEGEETSILVVTDGTTIVPLVASQDHKRVGDGDQGPNTGGMGAYAPAPLVDEAMAHKIISEVFEPLIRGLKKEGKKYKGILYGGLMIKDNQPYVLEFNVRFGDPETQVVLPKLKSDLLELMIKTTEERLEGVMLEWDPRYCVGVVLASEGYPGSYEKGKEISGLDTVAAQKDIYVFHAGTQRTEGGKIVTDGGRVLNVVGMADTLILAKQKAYQGAEMIDFNGVHFRRDIGDKGLKLLFPQAK
ncbi:MAG: phosphoribosylamine--glycine ligase [Candidatus Omnitrophica bacterium]|nr:phosphoribosylamine--glycine ligase [Candidatus Omnitrophota bacterium]